LEEEVEVAKQFITGLLERIGAQARVEGFVKEGSLYLEIKSDQEGILIGRHGRTLDSLEILINRMVNKRLIRAVRVVLDIDDYPKRRADTLTKMALRLGEKPRGEVTPSRLAHPFNAQDRRLIHIALKEDPSIRTESLGEGKLKKITIIPTRSNEERRN